MNTSYLNTDLEIESREDLAAGAGALEAGGLWVMFRDETPNEDGLYFARFEVFEVAGQSGYRADQTVSTLLSAVEALPPPLRRVWDACSLRLFDLGYQSGKEPFAFQDDLSAETLRRLTAVGGSLRVTLYRVEPQRGPRRGRRNGNRRRRL